MYLSYVLNVVVIYGCLILLYCAFQPVVALINHLLTYLCHILPSHKVTVHTLHRTKYKKRNILKTKL